MYPTVDACKALYRFHPKARIGWHGKNRQNEDDLNSGDFALIQLYHVSDVGTYDNPNTFMQFWNDPWHYFGPIFDRNGGGKRDWDPLFWVPIYVANLTQFGIPIQDIFSGKFIKLIEPWATNQLKRAKQARENKIKQMRKERDERAEAMGDRWWYEMNKPDQTGVICTREEKREAQQYMEKQAILQDQQLTEEFSLPGR